MSVSHTDAIMNDKELCRKIRSGEMERGRQAWEDGWEFNTFTYGARAELTSKSIILLLYGSSQTEM